MDSSVKSSETSLGLESNFNKVRCEEAGSPPFGIRMKPSEIISYTAEYRQRKYTKIRICKADYIGLEYEQLC